MYTLTTASKELVKRKKYIHRKSHYFLFHMDSKKVDMKSIKLTLFFYHPTLRRESSFTAGPKATGLHTGYTRLQLLSYYFGPSTYVPLTGSLLLHSPVRIPNSQKKNFIRACKFY